MNCSCYPKILAHAPTDLVVVVVACEALTAIKYHQQEELDHCNASNSAKPNLSDYSAGTVKVLFKASVSLIT